jgi:hypothetical protein
MRRMRRADLAGRAGVRVIRTGEALMMARSVCRVMGIAPAA